MKRRAVFVFVISIILLVRIAYFFAQPDLSTDHISQMAMAQNFMDGNGFSFKFLDDHQKIYYKTHIQWPPLYPFILALISFLTTNTLISSFVVQVAVLLSLTIIWRKIFNLFKDLVTEEAYFYFISLLIISTSILNNINTVLVFTLLLLTLSLYFTFAFLFDEKFKKINLFLSTFFASLLFWTHYSYFFVAFYPSVVLFITFFLGKNKSLLYNSVNSFIMSLTVTSGVLIYNYLTTGSINYMDNTQIWDAGFFPEHLLLIDPFFLNAFFKSAYVVDYIFTNNQHSLIALLFKLVSLTIFVSIIILFLRLRKNKNLEFEKFIKLFLPFIIIIILTISFLLYFTLRYHEIPRPGWTHIGDPRYMSAVYLSIIAIILLLVFFRADYINKKVIGAIKLFLIFLIFINLTVNIYITSKEWGQWTYESNNYKNFQGELQTLYDDIKLESSLGNQPVFINNDLTVRSFRISQYAGAAVIEAEKIESIEQISSEIVFFFILPEKNSYREQDNQLLKWGKRFKLNNQGFVYNGLVLYKVNN